MKKVLLVASVISFIEWFNRDAIDYLLNDAHCEVHVACNLEYMNDTDPVRTTEYVEQMKAQGVVFHHLAFDRSPLNRRNIGVYRELKRLIDAERFDLVHCHTPTASILTRLAARRARKRGTQVMYTAHGFHFFKGAPKKNWLLFYPIEKVCSRFTDVLITITKEDFAIAKRKMNAKTVEYVPGVGVDIEKFQHPDNRAEKRAELGIAEDAFVVFSIGELNENKNHETVVRALGALGNAQVCYLIAGKGDTAEHLNALADEQGVQLSLLGFRKDIPELIGIADVFAFPSHREGLSKALMEAMAAGLPCVVSGVRGNTDLIDEHGGFLCDSHDVTAFTRAIGALIDDTALRAAMGDYNTKKVEAFSKTAVNEKMKALFDGILMQK